MPWFIEEIRKVLKCDEERAREVFARIEVGFDGHFSDLTKRQCATLIRDFA